METWTVYYYDHGWRVLAGGLDKATAKSIVRGMRKRMPESMRYMADEDDRRHW